MPDIVPAHPRKTFALLLSFFLLLTFLVIAANRAMQDSNDSEFTPSPKQQAQP